MESHKNPWFQSPPTSWNFERVGSGKSHQFNGYNSPLGGFTKASLETSTKAWSLHLFHGQYMVNIWFHPDFPASKLSLRPIRGWTSSNHGGTGKSSSSAFPFLLIALYGYGSIPINTIFSGMNIHLPAILMFTRGIGF